MHTKTTVIPQAELDRQLAFCDKTAALWQSKGIVPAAYVETYGCQQNEADSERIRGLLQPWGNGCPRARHRGQCWPGRCCRSSCPQS